MPCAAQEHPDLKKPEKKLYIIIKIFYIFSVLRIPSITKLGTPSNFLKKKKNLFALLSSKKKSPKKNFELKFEKKKKL